jgi:hypothetical protein
MPENMKIAVSLSNFSIYNQLFRHHFKIFVLTFPKYVNFVL